MRPLLALAFIIFGTFQILAQENLAPRSVELQRADSIRPAMQTPTDTIVGLTDSLTVVLNRASFGLDSLKAVYSEQATVLTRSTDRLKDQLDSLNKLGKESGRISSKVDSLKAKL